MGLDYSLLEVCLESIHLNPFRSIHGRVYASVIDTAAYWATYSSLKEDAGLISIDLNINNLAPINKGKLIVRGKCIKNGQTISLAEALVLNEKGKCLVHGTSKMLVSANLQTLDQISKFMDNNNLDSPPKFI